MVKKSQMEKVLQKAQAIAKDWRERGEASLTSGNVADAVDCFKRALGSTPALVIGGNQRPPSRLVVAPQN
jgi:hypothetical protein